MTDRVGRWGRAPIRGVDPYPPGPVDDADPTGGRHAFDHDAALTPIFTTLRRGEWRRPRQAAWPSHRPPSGWPSPHPRPAALRPVPDAVTRFRNDPLTAPLPVVPMDALDHGPADGFGPDGSGAVPIDPYAPASFVVSSTSPTEATTWWRSPLAAPREPAPPVAYDAAPYDAAPYDAAPYDAAPYDGAPYDAAPYDPAPYDPAPYDAAPYDPTPYDPAHGACAPVVPHPAAYAPEPYATPRIPAAYDPGHDRRRSDGRGHDGWGDDRPNYDGSGYDGREYDGRGHDAPVRYDIPRRARGFAHPMSYDPVTDSGRHHYRLAPAGW